MTLDRFVAQSFRYICGTRKFCMRRLHIVSVFALLLLSTSGLAWLEWGRHSECLFDMEFTLLTGGGSDGTFLHPAVIFPMMGQCCLLLAFFVPRRWLLLAGTIPLFLLLLLVFLPGVLSANIRMMVSPLPFLVLSIWSLVATRPKRQKESRP